MFKIVKKYNLFFFSLALLCCVIFIFYLDYSLSNRKLTFAMLDIGQGDALFIESPSGVQILVDGGPPKKIIRELSKVMSPIDHYIDAIIITNPDQDHIGGFSDILDIYKVGQVFEPGTINNSKTYKNLIEKIENKDIPITLIRRGMHLDMGKGVNMDILFPDRDVLSWKPNDGSVVARLTYNDISIMLTGDATLKTERIILAENKIEDLQSDVLKVGHHGSRTSTGESFLRTVSPDYALISNGKDNRYGHPHQEVLNVLDDFKTKVLRTDILETIIIKSDGEEIFYK